ncbi:MAG: hypothetical protein AABX01_03275 [Candidatus Micrarchaeota archaeon]
MGKMGMLLLIAAAIAIPISAAYATASDDQKAAMQNLWQGKVTAKDIPLLNSYNQQFADERALMERMQSGELTASDVAALNELHANGGGGGNLGRGLGRGMGGCGMFGNSTNSTFGQPGFPPFGKAKGMHMGMMRERDDD